VPPLPDAKLTSIVYILFYISHIDDFFFGPPVMGKKIIVGNAVPAQAGAKFIKHIDVHHLFESAYQLDKPLFFKEVSVRALYIYNVNCLFLVPWSKRTFNETCVFAGGFWVCKVGCGSVMNHEH